MPPGKRSTTQRCHLHRKVVPERIERRQRRELTPQPFDRRLPDLLGLLQVLQPVTTEIDERGLGAEVVAHQVGRRLREQHLTIPPARPQPRTTDDDSLAEVVPLVAQLRLARVHRHPVPQLGARRPHRSIQCSLSSDC